jgi:hypothetical protein
VGRRRDAHAGDRHVGHGHRGPRDDRPRAGSWITDGVRVGDVVKLNATGGPAGNNNRNLRVVGVTALTLTVAETLTVDATPRTTYTLTIAKKVVQPSVPVRRSFTFEEYENDVDLTASSPAAASRPCTSWGSRWHGDDRVRHRRLQPAPARDGRVAVLHEPDAHDLDRAHDGRRVDPLRRRRHRVAHVVRSHLRPPGRDQPVIGSTITPDVFDNPATISGSISGIRQDFTNITRALAETELELQVLLVEPESEPKDFLSIWLPRIKITVPDKSYGNDGALIETMPFMVGPKEGTTGYDTTMIGFSTSAP